MDIPASLSPLFHVRDSQSCSVVPDRYMNLSPPAVFMHRIKGILKSVYDTLYDSFRFVIHFLIN